MTKIAKVVLLAGLAFGILQLLRLYRGVESISQLLLNSVSIERIGGNWGLRTETGAMISNGSTQALLRWDRSVLLPPRIVEPRVGNVAFIGRDCVAFLDEMVHGGYETYSVRCGTRAPALIGQTIFGADYRAGALVFPPSERTPERAFSFEAMQQLGGALSN